MDRSVTLQDVAKAAGVSGATVSRALRDDPRISPPVIERVKAAAAKLRYAPNPLVQALMTQKRRKLDPHGETLALITNVADEAWKKKDVCLWYLKGLQRRAQQLGYQIEVFSLGPAKGDAEHLRRVLITRGIRGLILGFSERDDQPTTLDVGDFCVVGLSTYFRQLPVDRVQLHGFFNVNLAFEKMRSLGYRRPALIAPVRNNTIVGGQWSAAALNEQWQRPPEEQCPPLMTEADGVNMAEFREWMEQHEPDALLVYKIDILELLGRLRLKVPKDIGVAYLFGTEAERKKMAGIDGNLDRVGAAAVDLLVQKMHMHDRGIPEHPRDVLITGSWKDGPSLPVRSAQTPPARPGKKSPKRVSR
ncbi:LacI family transcriptional regulator [Prosthecobacter fusiformis]|uniref:LacI family transcriptional regulator n=1 Tax=Prosthecobacter fusiformis TaxID=48464 RepID=A0A4R7S1W9_9BACT|nr:LacI family DNA-binding transcriptional regulator [Prosthecobacter fusiformis]TDU71215.1 LacI family transcriptional regulator [Prosthecobacter fusiformis]